MPIPTIGVKGRLRAPNGDPKLQKELDEWVPYEYIAAWIRNRREKAGLANRVIVLKAETASGKSTMFVAEIYRHVIMPQGKSSAGVIVTQPRTLTAIRNVPQMIWQSGPDYPTFLKLGETIGWSTRFNKYRAKRYGILSATIGTLAQQLNVYTDQEIMNRYRIIMIDETHERDLQIDMTLYRLKNFLMRNKDNPACPFVILMSATFDPTKFLAYFNCTLENFIWCEGRSVGFDIHWDWNQDRVVNNYPQAAAIVTERIVRENEDDKPEQADVLIFMPGRSEIKQTGKWLSELNAKLAEEKRPVFSILQIDSEAQRTESLDYRRLDIPTSDHRIRIGKEEFTPRRRVIISTNVAETGLTLSNLKYVIDGGYNREIEYNPNYGIRALITKPAPQSRIKQRMGRAGRLFPGHFYPLYPKYIYDMLPEQQYPQILLEDVSLIMLDIINEQLKMKALHGDKSPEFVVADIDMLDVPTPDAIHNAIEKLYALGFIAPSSPPYDPVPADSPADAMQKREPPIEGKFGLTYLGRAASAFNMLPPEIIRMILSGFYWGSSIMDLITISAYVMTDTRSLTAQPVNPKLKLPIDWAEVYKAGAPRFLGHDLLKVRMLIADEFIDGIFLYHAIRSVASSVPIKDSINALKTWCAKARVSYDGALGLIRTRDEIAEQMLVAGFDIFANESAALSRCEQGALADVITQLKYCIYDGFRLNILRRDNDDYYAVHGNIKVITPRLFTDAKLESVKPSIFVYRELSVKYNRKTGIFDVRCDHISAMDGYVNVDLSYAA